MRALVEWLSSVVLSSSVGLLLAGAAFLLIVGQDVGLTTLGLSSWSTWIYRVYLFLSFASGAYFLWQRYRAQRLCSIGRRLRLSWAFLRATAIRTELETATVTLRGEGRTTNVVIYLSGDVEPTDSVLLPVDGLQDVVGQVLDVAQELGGEKLNAPRRQELAEKLRTALRAVVRVLDEQDAGQTAAGATSP